MNIFASFRYQMADQKRGVLVYYLTIIAVFLVFGVLLVAPIGSQGSVVTNGLTAVTAITLFIMSLCSFKENFGMAVQNGVTRRSLFLGRLCTTGAVCAIMAVMDEILTRLVSLPGQLMGMNITSRSLFENMYGAMLGESMNPFLLFLCSTAFSFMTLLLASALGYFITLLFYRLNKLGKILVGAGVPAFFLVGVPALKMLNEQIAGGKIGEAVVKILSSIMRFMLGEPQNAMLSYFAMFALLSLLAWLLMRRATVK